MQSESATLNKILDALIKMKRYDILKAVEEPFCKLAECFTKDDSGYQSYSDTSEREITSLANSIVNDLPPALSQKYVMNADKQQPSLKLSTKVDAIEDDTVKPTLFLTYTEDGFDTAINIQQYVNNWEDFPDITILTLNAKREEVVQNPEKFIRENFEKVCHFILLAY